MQSKMLSSNSEQFEKSTYQRFEKEATNILTRFVDNINKNSEIKILQVKRDVANQFKAMAEEVFLQTFIEYYGLNFDIGSLMESLDCTLDNNLHPKLFYNTNVFQFDVSLKANEEVFNQNAKKEGAFKRIEDPDFILRDIDVDDLILEDSNAYEDAIEDLTEENYMDYKIFIPHNKMNRQGGYTPLNQVYNIAYSRTLKQFQEELEKNIKPKIYKKYKIKMG